MSQAAQQVPLIFTPTYGADAKLTDESKKELWRRYRAGMLLDTVVFYDEESLKRTEKVISYYQAGALLYVVTYNAYDSEFMEFDCGEETE